MQNISKELRAQIPKFESGKQYRFQLLGVKRDEVLKRLLVPNSINILPQDVIYDPYLGHQVEITCVDRVLPTGKDSAKAFDTKYATIKFVKEEAGVKVLNGSNKRDLHLFEYLWLSNYNSANKGKEWYIEPMNGCKYTFLEPEKTAADKLDEERMIHKAKDVVFNLTEKDLRVACKALGESKMDDFRYQETMLESQMRERLLAFAVKNPKRVLTLDKDLNLEIRHAIKAAKDAGLIAFDTKRKEVVWADSGNRICIIEPGKDAETSLVGFFITKVGSEVLKTILANLQTDTPNKKEKVVDSAEG